MRSKLELIESLAKGLRDDPFWSDYFLENFQLDFPRKNLHVAIFREPFLQWVFDGTKTVESRFSKNEVVPYNTVEEGDAVLLKEVGGPLVGICRASAAWSYRLDPTTWKYIRSRFSDMIGLVDDEFWEIRQGARFATLISLDNVFRFPPTPYLKSDRRGWVIERTRFAQTSLDL
jgi:hypothetical protein